MRSSTTIRPTPCPRHRADRHREAPARQGAGCEISVSRGSAVGPRADRLERGAAGVTACDARLRAPRYGGQAGQRILQGATRLGHRRRSRPGDGPDGLSSVGGSVNGHGARPPSPASRSSRGRFQRAPRSTPHRSSHRSDGVSRSPPSAAIRRHACSCGRSTRAMPLSSKGPTERSTCSGRPTACRSGFSPAAN